MYFWVAPKFQLFWTSGQSRLSLVELYRWLAVDLLYIEGEREGEEGGMYLWLILVDVLQKTHKIL